MHGLPPDEGLRAAGIDRSALYVTNAVKHFEWEPRGKRRLHKTPAQRELEACYQWLESEIAAVTQSRGKVQRREGLAHIATYHLSFLLRVKDRPGEEDAWKQFVADLRLAAKYLKD